MCSKLSSLFKGTFKRLHGFGGLWALWRDGRIHTASFLRRVRFRWVENETDNNWFGGAAIKEFLPCYLQLYLYFIYLLFIRQLVFVFARICAPAGSFACLRPAGSKPESISAPLHSGSSPSCQSHNTSPVKGERWLAEGCCFLNMNEEFLCLLNSLPEAP